MNELFNHPIFCRYLQMLMIGDRFLGIALLEEEAVFIRLRKTLGGWRLLDQHFCPVPAGGAEISRIIGDFGLYAEKTCVTVNTNGLVVELENSEEDEELLHEKLPSGFSLDALLVSQLRGVEERVLVALDRIATIDHYLMMLRDITFHRLLRADLVLLNLLPKRFTGVFYDNVSGSENRLGFEKGYFNGLFVDTMEDESTIFASEWVGQPENALLGVEVSQRGALLAASAALDGYVNPQSTLNLLKHPEAQATYFTYLLKKQIIALGMIILLFTGAIYLANFFLGQYLAGMQEKHSALKPKLLIKNALDAEKEALEKAHQQLTIISAQRSEFGAILFLLAEDLPTDAWFKEINFSEKNDGEHALKISGIAKNEGALTELMKNLENYDFVKNLHLKKMSRKSSIANQKKWGKGFNFL